LLCAELMVNSITLPLGRLLRADISGGTSWVGPMMKLPSTFAGGVKPSVISLAVTKPGVLGSRVDGAGRSVCCPDGGVSAETGLTATTRLTTRQMVTGRGSKGMVLFCSIRNSGKRV
jgi:hypothetical protein